MNLGVDGAFVLPVGNWGDVTGPMIGGLLRFEYPASPAFAVTGRAGYLYGLQKDVGGYKFSISDIPIWAGGKYYFDGEPDGVYGAAELGLNMLSVKSTIPAISIVGFSSPEQSVSSSETKFGANIGAGYKAGPLDIRAGLDMFDLGHAGDSMGVMATVGYNFVQF